MKKRCTKCGIEKSLDEFHKAKEGRLGVRAICKECRKPYDKAQRKNYKAKNRKK